VPSASADIQAESSVDARGGSVPAVVATGGKLSKDARSAVLAAQE